MPRDTKKKKPIAVDPEADPSWPTWSRRDLLVRGGQTLALGGLAAGAAGYLHDPEGDAGLQHAKPVKLHEKDYFAKVNFDAGWPRISATFGKPDKIDDLDHVQRMVTAAIGELTGQQGMKAFIAKGDVVVLKPNVGFDRPPQLGATTNPQVVRAVIRLCKEAGARKVIVADNPIENPAACFARSGIKDVVEAEDATLIIHTKACDAPAQVRTEKPDPTKGEALGIWPIFWKPFEHANKVIGIPPIKDHNLCSASMGMKNWYGLLGGRRNQFHQAINNIISDLGLMMRPTLMVVDGTRVMMRNGPTGGRVEDIKIGGVAGRPTVVASVDQLACDSWCYQKLLGRDPTELSYLDLAYKKFGHDDKRIVAPSWEEYHKQNKVKESPV